MGWLEHDLLIIFELKSKLVIYKEKHVNKKLVILICLIVLISMPCFAKHNVYAKYYGSVDLDKFKHYQVISSFIFGVWYDKRTEKMILLLNFTYYAYCGVDEHTFGEFMKSLSKGRFLNKYIKNKFNCNG